MNGLSFIRLRCNLSQGQLAEKLGVTRQAIHLWENRRELGELLFHACQIGYRPLQ